MPTLTPADPAAFDVLNATRIMGVGRSTVFEEIRTGRLEARKVGRKTLITRSAIENWLQKLPVRTVACTPIRGSVPVPIDIKEAE